MGYPMTYPRVVLRNGLNGSYSGTLADEGAPWKRMIAGDLRRLEQDATDDLHIARFAKAAGISKPKARAVLQAFFTDCGIPGPLEWLGADPYAGAAE